MTATPTVIANTAQPTAGARPTRGILLGLAIVAVLFAGGYAAAWYRAAQLTATFIADADASYAAGRYIDALTGYEEFNQATNQYVTHGGYMQVTRIWADPNAWPRPASVERAQVRIDEILSRQLTIADAEGFIQANIGKQNPYQGAIYLRLGELYEQAGDHDSAQAIYSEIAELFPGEEELIAKAKEHLARLGDQ